MTKHLLGHPLAQDLLAASVPKKKRAHLLQHEPQCNALYSSKICSVYNTNLSEAIHSNSLGRFISLVLILTGASFVYSIVSEICRKSLAAMLKCLTRSSRSCVGLLARIECPLRCCNRSSTVGCFQLLDLRCCSAEQGLCGVILPGKSLPFRKMCKYNKVEVQ